VQRDVWLVVFFVARVAYPNHVGLTCTQTLHYYEAEGGESKGCFSLYPGSTVEKHTSAQHKFLLQLKMPASFGKDRHDARAVWLDCESEDNQTKWFQHLTRSCMVSGMGFLN
jgi:hypothetical protein